MFNATSDSAGGPGEWATDGELYAAAFLKDAPEAGRVIAAIDAGELTECEECVFLRPAGEDDCPVCREAAAVRAGYAALEGGAAIRRELDAARRRRDALLVGGGDADALRESARLCGALTALDALRGEGPSALHPLN